MVNGWVGGYVNISQYGLDGILEETLFYEKAHKKWKLEALRKWIFASPQIWTAKILLLISFA